MKRVAVIMGSKSDWPTMSKACEVMDALEVPYDVKVVSAHRTPKRLYDFCETAESNGYAVVIAGAGGAAHLPGMTAAMTPVPVIGVPVRSSTLSGVDSYLSIAQMPKGVAVATQAIGEAGAFNAGLLAAQMLAISDRELAQRVVDWREAQTLSVPEAP